MDEPIRSMAEHALMLPFWIKLQLALAFLYVCFAFALASCLCLLLLSRLSSCQLMEQYTA